jgi:hypothetical protein
MCRGVSVGVGHPGSDAPCAAFPETRNAFKERLLTLESGALNGDMPRAKALLPGAHECWQSLIERRRASKEPPGIVSVLRQRRNALRQCAIEHNDRQRKHNHRQL